MKALLTVAIVLAVTGGAASAQERGQVGVAMGYPTAVSVIWHATDRLAIQPRVSFARSSTESTIESNITFNGVIVSSTSLTTRSQGWSVGSGMDVRFYIARWDAVSTYVAPGFSYSRGSSTSVMTSQNAFTGNQIETRKSSSDGHAVRGTFGVQYTPHERVAVFADVGLQYSRTDPGIVGNTTLKTLGNTSAVGAIFYF
jgi:hypothetical protein